MPSAGGRGSLPSAFALKGFGIIGSVELGKLLRKEVRGTLWPLLREHGFTRFSDLAAWREDERWTDCVQVMTLGAYAFGEPRRLGEEVYANAATFTLEIGTYYTDVHLLPWTGPVPERPRLLRAQGSRYPVCHRQRALARSYEFGNVQGTLFPSADNGSDLDRVVADAGHALESRGLAWLDTTHDIDALLARKDGEPSDELEDLSEDLELSDEEQSELALWRTGRDIEAGESFTISGNAGIPQLLWRRLQATDLRDHTSIGLHSLSGDLLYGLLVGSGRIEEALATMRRDADPAPDESRYAEMLANGFPKRTASQYRKRFASLRERIRAHLAMLEVAASVLRADAMRET